MRLTDALDFLRLLARRFQDNRCPQVAGSLTFTTLLSLVPLVTVALVTFSQFPVFATLGNELRTFLLQNLLPDKAGKIIATYAFQFSQKAANLTVLGSVMLVVGALTLLLTIDRVFNQIWGVQRPRSWALRLPVYWAALTLGPIALAGGIAASSYVMSASLGLVDEPAWVRIAALRAVPAALFIAMFSFLYRTVPNHPVRLTHALAGGVTAALLTGLVQRLLGLFLGNFQTYTLIYGTFAALPIFLLWLYFSWVAILLGALVAAILPDFKDRHAVLPDYPGDRSFSAARMLSSLAAVQQKGGSASSAALHLAARCTPDIGEQILGQMREAGWIARTEEGAWLLTRPAQTIALADVVRLFSLAPRRAAELDPTPLVTHLAEALEACLLTAQIPVAPEPAPTPSVDQMG
ncbi:MAG: YihY family inner membrane protein [Rhodocyclaceae bacterium]|jgi:membrane protein|nr:YihY family inner membrane protein [Rhodocyclaceae bacterium]